MPEQHYFIIYKPAGMVSQFVSPDHNTLLCHLDHVFPEGTQAVGRLDADSEGLLILTTDKTLIKRLMHPDKKHQRRYMVYVEYAVQEETLQKLCSGIDILIKNRGPYHTMPCTVNKIEPPANLAPFYRSYTEYKPHTWLEFILTEGKNRQIRKMCSAVKHNCRRLIRTHIEDLSIGDLMPGEVRQITKEELFGLLRLPIEPH